MAITKNREGVRKILFLHLPDAQPWPPEELIELWQALYLSHQLKRDCENGPLLKAKVPSSGRNTSVPVISLGNRSGVNCIL